jgi:predicted ABC-type ATPase
VTGPTPDPRPDRGRWAIVLAGPNGAGKTTGAPGILRAGIEYLNADVVAAELRRSGQPATSADITAGRLILASLRQAVIDGQSFCLETNLAGPGLLRHIRQWQVAGYHVRLAFIWLATVELALQRVALRSTRGGHDVAPDVVRRRYRAGLAALDSYIAAVDSWEVFDNDSTDHPALLVAEGGTGADPIIHDSERWVRIRASIAQATNDVPAKRHRGPGVHDTGA